MSTELLLFGDDPRASLTDSPVAVDIETTGLYWRHQVLGIALAWRDADHDLCSAFLSDPVVGGLPLFGGPALVPTRLLTDILQAHLIIMHNHPFDYRMLFKQYGVPAIPRLLDTMHMATNLGPHESRSLENLFSQYVQVMTDEHLRLKARRGSLVGMDLESRAKYGQLDAEATLRLYEVFLAKIHAGHPYKRLIDSDIRFNHLVMGMVQAGIPVDREYCRTRIQEIDQECLAINQQLVRSGIRNPGSYQEIHKFAKRIDLTIPDTSEETLSQYSDIPEFALLLRFRSLQKARGSWYLPLLELSEHDGRFHSQLSPFGTVSYRMSSSDINAQGIPMEDRGNPYGSMLGVFKSNIPDHSLWALDVKQAEIRMAALISQDRALIAATKSGTDVYTALATTMWDDASRRQDAKRAMLSAIYEVGIPSFSQQYGVSMEVAEETLNTVRARFPALRKRSWDMRGQAAKAGFVKSPLGRLRWFSQEEREKTPYKGFNQEVQMSVAELMAHTMLKVDLALPDQTILQVHDSLVLFLPDDPQDRQDQIDLVQAKLQQTVEEMVPYSTRPDMYVPFLLDAKLYQLEAGHISGGATNGKQ